MRESRARANSMFFLMLIDNITREIELPFDEDQTCKNILQTVVQLSLLILDAAMHRLLFDGLRLH